MRARPCLVSVLVLTAGCAGSELPPPDAGVTLGALELCQRLSTAQCGLLARCYVAFQQAPAADCAIQRQSECLETYERLRPALTAGQLSVDRAALERCEARLTGSACAPTYPPGHPAGGASPFSDCSLERGVLVGTVASGQPCDDPRTCEPGTVCIKPGGVCRGTCAQLPGADEACGVGCREGTYCEDFANTDPTDDRCAPLKAVDSPCESSAECSQALHCQGGVCRSPGGLGEPCVFDPQRASTCLPGMACDVTPFVAGAVGACVVPGQAGARCRFHFSCAAGLVCYDQPLEGFPQSQLPEGTCTPPTAAGEGCATSPYVQYVGDTCQPGSRCTTAQRCEPLPERGSNCSVSAQDCAGLDVYCKPLSSGDLGVCAGPAGIHEACAVRLDDERVAQIPCTAGYCDTETTLTCREANRQLGQLCTSDGECVSNRCAVQEDRTRRCAQACF